MEFLQPIYLWGILGLSIPVAIHLWNGKRGTSVHWAAMAWLSEQENLSSKSIRLDQIFVLILRILMLSFLVFLLSKLILKSWLIPADAKKVHLVAPDNQVYEEFRFEIEKALEDGQKVFWMEPGKSEIQNPIDPEWSNPNQIQETLNQLTDPISELHLYLPNSQNFLPENLLVSPTKPEIHLATTASKKSSSHLKLDSAYFLEMNEMGVLELSENSNQSNNGIDLKQLTFFLGELEDEEKSNIRAAFASISEVMKINLREVEKKENAKLILDLELPQEYDRTKLYFLIGNEGYEQKTNVRNFPDRLDFESSELVRNGELPEYLLSELISFLGIHPVDVKLSKSQMESRFLVQEIKNRNEKSGLEIVLVGLFLLTFGLERFYSNRNGI